ncbi:MAG TPA: SufE family protein [Candidatus Saccharimonadales bacterium]|nr:SufE family protein [Candidatus Saccharimonadales bacterium]
MTLLEKQRELLAALAAIKDGQERFAWLIHKGKSQAALPATLKTPENRVEGCLSNLWFVPEFRDGRCWFESDADSLIVKSIAGLLCDFYSGSHPREILKLDPSFLGEVGINQHLTPNRRNSLSRVWTRIYGFASECLESAAKESSSLLVL